MKKIFLAIAALLIAAQPVLAQNEVQYVEDNTQGLLLNNFNDNWFIQVEGGVNALWDPTDPHRNFWDRFAPAASIYVGKWFSPIIGLRVGADWYKLKDVSTNEYAIGATDDMTPGGLYKLNFAYLGPAADAMINLTNWWCGYKSDRFYTATLYGGAAWYITFARQPKIEGSREDGFTGYKDTKDNILAMRAGLLNNFRLSNHFDIFLDLRATVCDSHNKQGGNRIAFDPAAYLGLTYKFDKTGWSYPIVPIIPTPEDCEPYREALMAAQAQIADLESQITNCLESYVPCEEPAAAPLATIYFPINVSKLTREDIRVVNAVAEIMKANPDTHYLVTGWADNYTGTHAINTRLRKERAGNVEKQLLKAGVAASQVSTAIDENNLYEGEKFMALDRAATITIAE